MMKPFVLAVGIALAGPALATRDSTGTSSSWAGIVLSAAGHTPGGAGNAGWMPVGGADATRGRMPAAPWLSEPRIRVEGSAPDRTSASSDPDPISVLDCGADRTGTVDSTSALQDALDAASSRGGVVRVPEGTYLYTTLTPRSNVTIAGSGQAIMRQLQPSAAPAGFFKAAGAGSLSNFHVLNLTFDGARVATPTRTTNHIFDIELAAGESVSDLSWENCSFRDAQYDFIRLHTNSAAATGTRIRVVGNRFETTARKRNLGGSSTPVAFDAVRIEYENADNSPGTYGVTPFTDIEVSWNYAESIRTLADLKRGCRDFRVANNRTLNMYDCHHSVDGSFGGTLTGNAGWMDPTYPGPLSLGATGPDFIEVQGEGISVVANTFDGGNRATSGIMVTSYGRPEETVNGHQVGHQSVGVIVSANKVRNVTVNGLRLIDTVNSSLTDNYVEGAGAHVATVEAPGTSYDASGMTPLHPLGNRISSNRSRNATGGVFVADVGRQILGSNLDENGEESIHVPSTAGATAGLGSDAAPGNLVRGPAHEWAFAECRRLALAEAGVGALGPLRAPRQLEHWPVDARYDWAERACLIMLGCSGTTPDDWESAADLAARIVRAWRTDDAILWKRTVPARCPERAPDAERDPEPR